MNQSLRQIRTNALSAKFLHTKFIKKLEPQRSWFNRVSIIVPIFITCLLYLTKGTDGQGISEVISFIISGLLIAYGVYYLESKIDDRIYIHKLYANKNIDVANEAETLLRDPNLPPAVLDWFTKYVSELDQQDNQSLKDVTEEERRESYRAALKEFEAGNHNIVCEICNKSPWEYIPGNCQLCGNKKD